jgi:hypothetical protein
MDVGFYLGELLMQQGEVSVPGLGYFVQARVSGYYDENERKFYPPYHKAQFDVQSIDDDALAEYIAAKKNISVASAKYFSEKYITNLKQQALIGEVPIGNLGVFYTELAQLTFRPAEKIIDDTIFYGFEPVSLNKAGDIQPVEERPKVELNYPPRTPQKPAVTEEVSAEAPVEQSTQEFVAPPVYQEQEAGISPEFFDPDEEEEAGGNGTLKLLLIILITIVVIGVGVFALYRYQPDTFAKIAFWQPKVQVVKLVKPKDTIKAKVADTVNTDSAKTDTVKTDTTAVKTDTVAKTAVTTKKEKVISVQPVVPGKKKEVIISQTEVPAAKKQVITAAPPKKKDVIISQTEVTAKKQTLVTQPATIAANNPAVTKPKTIKPVTAMDRLEDRTYVVAPPSTAVGTRRFEVYAATCNTVAEANAAIRKIRKGGFDPRVVTDGPGPEIHISIGHFATKQEATDLAMRAIESGSMPGGTAYGIEIIPQK